ncbi:MAG: M3 family metallopeptidase [Pseudomonadales bacterium]|jgi:oligopeptidase A|nr:M3 family metallopeptidase [Pseudomonadales bacterium]
MTTSTRSEPSPHDLPAFGAIDVEGVIPELERLLDGNLALLDTIAAAKPSWETVVEPLEEAGDALARLWSPIRHLHAVADDDVLRRVYEQGLPKLTDYGNRFGQHEGLYRAYRALADADGFERESPARRMAVEQALRDFRLSGIDLDADAQARFREISQRLSELGNRFSQNLLDATDAWTLEVTPERLAGLPEAAREKALAEARTRGVDGAVITLDGPTYLAVMSHAEDRALRRSVYEAWVTRASALGQRPEEWDNAPLVDEILALRDELARLLGYGSWAERQLEGRMARRPEEVLAFLDDLAARSLPQARREYQELCEFAREELDLEAPEAWDLAFAGERLRRARYDVSQEALRPWFPVDRVIEGLFSIVGRLFGIEVVERTDWPVWHESVRCFEVLRPADGGASEVAGRFYLDLYARRHKRGGAWMDGCRGRRRTATGVQVPVAFLTCNFSGPVTRADGAMTPALLTHDEVTTLFHEFGHGIHHMLTCIDVADVAGISGVPWDAVELPSQFLENWCWHPEAVALISGHHETGEPLPAELLDRLVAARNFQSAMMMVRQLEFGLFDFRLHHDYRATPGFVREVIETVRAQVAVVQPPAFNRFENGFGHIFSGGYSAGYYSYKWAEVLSADAFARFEEDGIFDQAAGRDFLHCILERGGSEPPAELFRRFRGRDPDIAPLLRHSGIVGDDA